MIASLIGENWSFLSGGVDAT